MCPFCSPVCSQVLPDPTEASGHHLRGLGAAGGAQRYHHGLHAAVPDRQDRHQSTEPPRPWIAVTPYQLCARVFINVRFLPSPCWSRHENTRHIYFLIICFCIFSQVYRPDYNILNLLIYPALISRDLKGIYSIDIIKINLINH